MKNPKCRTCGKEHRLGAIWCSVTSGSSNGKTSDFGSDNGGSNPSPEARQDSEAVERTRLQISSRKGVTGSNPVPVSNADVAQLVERLPSKQEVEGSRPFVRSNLQEPFDRLKYQREYMRDKATINRLGLEMKVKAYRESLK